MKIERDSGDLRVEKMIRSKELPMMIPKENIYSLNILVTNTAIMSTFLTYYMFTEAGQKELEEKCGFQIKSVNNYVAKNMSYVMGKLKECMDYLNRDEDFGEDY